MDVNLSNQAPQAHFEDEIKNQALVRMCVVAFMGCYFLFTGHWTHPVYVAFVVYATLVFILVRTTPLSTFRPIILVPTVLIDNAFSLLGLHVTADAGYFLFVLLAQIACGFGTRFGLQYLWLSVTISSTGIAALWAMDPYWARFPHACVAFAIGVPFLAIYFDYLRRRVDRNAMSKMFHAREYSDVLRAFAHDVRTQLQALHVLAESLLPSDQNVGSARAIDGILRITKSIARITSFEVLRNDQNVEGCISPQPREDETEVTLGSWLGDIVQRFSGTLERKDAILCIWLESPLPVSCELPVISAERALINVLSNACRYAEGGELVISLAWDGLSAGNGNLRISIENSVCELTEKRAETSSTIGRTDYFGAGMGQSIAAQLLESVGGGATFEQSGEGRYRVELWIPASVSSDSPLSLPPRQIVIFSNQCPDELERIKENLSSEREVHSRPLTEWLADGDLTGQSGNASVIIDLRKSTEASEVSIATKASLTDRRVYLLCERIAPDRRVGRLIVGVLDDGGMSGALETGLLFAETLDPIPQSIVPDPVVSKQLNGVRLLLVDDSASYCEKLSFVLRSAGATVESAHTIESALELAQANDYDALILDWLAGDETMREFLDRYKKPREAPAAPEIYILTGADRKDVVASLGPHRVRCVLTKPISMKYLIETIANSRTASSGSVKDHPEHTRSTIAFVGHAGLEGFEGFDADGHVLRSLAAKAQVELKEVRGRLANAARLGGDECYRRELHSLVGIADAVGASELGAFAARLLRNHGSLGVEDLARELSSVVNRVERTIEELRAYIGEE